MKRYKSDANLKDGFESFLTRHGIEALVMRGLMAGSHKRGMRFIFELPLDYERRVGKM